MEVLKQPKTPINLAIIALIISTACACFPDTEDALFPDQIPVNTSGDAGSNDADLDSSDTFSAPTDDLSGTWALVMDWSTCVTIFTRTELRNRYITRVRITQEGNRLREEHTVCSIANTPLLDLETVIPQAVPDSYSPFTVESALLGTPGNLGYIGGTQTHLWGLQLSDPLADPFPETFDPDNPDPRIFDADNDGLPGVTLQIGGDLCQAYVYQRLLASVQGQVQPDGSILGSGYNVTQQNVIDASNSFCSTPYTTESNDSHSVMKMIRVDAQGPINFDTNNDGDVSCDELRAQSNSLVQWIEADDARCETE